MSAPAVEPLVAFARALRAEGMVVGPGDVATFCQACQRLGPMAISDVYWAGRASLVDRAADLPTYDEVFRRRFGPDEGRAWASPVERPEASVRAAVHAGEAERGPPSATEQQALVAGLAASDVERLRHTRFEDLTDAERAAVHRLIAGLRVVAPRRRSRRTAAAPRGRHVDLRRSLRGALRTDGEMLRRARRERRHQPRRLVWLLDVSRSMAESSRALLLLAHAAARGPGPVEAWCFGTRLTRVTDALQRRDPQQALAAAAARAADWDGGTRIGESLRDFLARGGRAGSARGAVIVICSDGLERGDPQLLARQAERLARLAYRVVWVNPLRGDPRYEPRAAGMAAALPHLDRFTSGHDLASLEALASLVGELADRRSTLPASGPAG